MVTAMGLRANLPFLPGFVGHDLTKTRHNRSQTLVYKLDSATDNLKQKPMEVDRDLLKKMAANPAFRLLGRKRDTFATHDERAAAKEAARNTYRPTVQPAWLKHDRQVLRFYIYLQEPRVETAIENQLYRFFELHYHLEDGTISIQEPKVENCGMPQGTFLKRHRAIVPGTHRYYAPEDLRCGEDVEIYSRRFRIYSADDFTKFYFSEAGLDMGCEESPPSDNFTVTQRFNKELPHRAVPKEVMDVKEYTELKLGGARKNDGLEQFVENDRHVLRFYAYWDDQTRYGTRTFFAVHYFLSDDTVEINECHTRNSGRDPYPCFFRRAKLPKKFHLVHVPGMLAPEPELYKPRDLKVGTTIQVFNRTFFLYDCDDFTRTFYKEYINLEQPKVALPKHTKTHTQLSYPPHTAFGSEEDSLASCLSLVPKLPKQDLIKVMSNSDRVLRFEASCDTRQPEDAQRKFIVGIFLSDDSVGVWEIKQRNSGQVEGKWAERSRKKNVATGTWFCPQDFFVGQTVTINGTPLYIRRADEYSLKYMEAHRREFPMCDIFEVMRKLQPLRDSPEARDAAAGGSKMTPQNLQQMMAEMFGVEITDQEVITVMRNLYEQCVEEEEDEVLFDVSKLLQALSEPPPLAGD
mmetsp:Transcript_1341/g.2931  ORF Transcript_1341/g.2931 Transcript_1341/m.2931 type:complete len:633 (-) Transcript_1341:206-2104(-)